MNQLAGKVAIVTGGASGIGREVALQFANEGSKVVIVDINEEKGKEIEKLIKDDRGSALFIRADITNPYAVNELYSKVEETYGKVDILFNNAGIFLEGRLTHELSFTEWKKLMSVNLDAVFLMARKALRYMLKNGEGVIVNTASAVSDVGYAQQAAYTASKHAVAGFTKTLALEYSNHNIRVNAISPGETETPLIDWYSKEELEAVLADYPIGRMAKPVEMAKAVVFLVSPDASYITGTNLFVDGGFTAK
ncbi:NAD(P)-dependent dehydrogenase, short-chain alcohol dehydrogenase family [Alteribacillus persepolensis]|uniref:NAD(P)-dependent dehydrogenase, short-chain alcohol dehydrogenase family n=1 Tax=Alteribacillus persepolensis TaxID=568899 RepID=A0A1G8KQP1_9BACI|nr:glucose 1-dehydrogenase [Alteribacillus persepolensis]SDI45737.1 NAD(P)-dependent dehydrogenase, short-chain alcohol dehydrogenase family [Alteribacillus persepolensis]